jgi:hypothetical protein
MSVNSILDILGSQHTMVTPRALTGSVGATFSLPNLAFSHSRPACVELLDQCWSSCWRIGSWSKAPPMLLFSSNKAQFESALAVVFHVKHIALEIKTI